MKKTFQVLNVKCSGCATSLKNALKADFGEVQVNLEKMPREITIEIEDESKEKLLRELLKQSGYPMSDENLTSLQDIGFKAKSFISCASGKIENFNLKS